MVYSMEEKGRGKKRGGGNRDTVRSTRASAMIWGAQKGEIVWKQQREIRQSSLCVVYLAVLSPVEQTRACICKPSTRADARTEIAPEKWRNNKDRSPSRVAHGHLWLHSTLLGWCKHLGGSNVSWWFAFPSNIQPSDLGFTESSLPGEGLLSRTDSLERSSVHRCEPVVCFEVFIHNLLTEGICESCYKSGRQCHLHVRRQWCDYDVECVTE